MQADIECIKKVTIGKGEKLAVVLGEHIPREQIKRLEQGLIAWLSCEPSQVAIFPPGTKLAVISKED